MSFMLDNLNNQSQASTPYLLTLFYVDPPVLPTNPFPNFVLSPPTPLTSLSPTIPTPNVLSVGLFLWLNWLSCHISCAIFCNDNMDLHSLGALVPEGP